MDRGLVYNKQSEYGRALDSLKESLEIFRRIGDRRGVADTLRGLGECWHLRSQSEPSQKQEHSNAALNAYEQALGVYSELGNTHFEAQTLVDIACVYEARNLRFEAREAANAALEAFAQTKNADATEKAQRTLADMGVI